MSPKPVLALALILLGMSSAARAQPPRNPLDAGDHYIFNCKYTMQQGTYAGVDRDDYEGDFLPLEPPGPGSGPGYGYWVVPHEISDPAELDRFVCPLSAAVPHR